MIEKNYVCAYSHCLHHGEKISPSSAVVSGRKYYHWDCAATKQEIEAIRNTYLEKIDHKASFPILSKVLNDLIFKYGLDIDYVRFAVNYYGEYKIKIKSPFTLLYLRKNQYMKKKWQKDKRTVKPC